MTIPKIASYLMPTEPINQTEKRVDWQPHKHRAALLIHDMQEYFLDFFDTTAEPINTLLNHIHQLRITCHAAGIPIYYTAQAAQQSPTERGLLQDWWGPGITAQPQRTAIAAAIAPKPQDIILKKWRYSAFIHSNLLEQLHNDGRDQLIICGVYAHIGCLLTAADAFMHDIQSFYISDAVADFSVIQHQMALDYVSQCCGVVVNTATILAALTSHTSLPTSLDKLRQEVAQILQIPSNDLQYEDNLLYAGLDSIRLMSLVERWRGLGANVSFASLGEKANLQQWWEQLKHTRPS